MFRQVVVAAIVVSALFGSELKVGENSFGFYEAKKDQFFSTYDVKGVSNSVSGSVTKNDNIYTGTLHIDARKFESGNDKRDAHVRDDYLNADEHPNIMYKFTVSGGISTGVMNINGVDKSISFPIQITENDDNTVVTGKVKVKYTDFGIETPSNLIVSAHEDLFIGATLYLIKE